MEQPATDHGFARGKPANGKIERIFAFVCFDPVEGCEGIPAVHTQFGVMPLIGSDLNRLESLRPSAELIAKQLGQSVKLMIFENPTVAEVIQP